MITYACLTHFASSIVNHSTAHKLSSCSSPWILGYHLHYRGYQFLDLKTNHIIISRHVIFDENTFHAAQKQTKDNNPYSFLDSFDDQPHTFMYIFKNHVLENTAPLPPITFLLSFLLHLHRQTELLEMSICNMLEWLWG